MRLKDIHIKIIVALNIIIFLAIVILGIVKGIGIIGPITAGFGIVVGLWIAVWILYIIGICIIEAVKYPQEAVWGALKLLGVFLLAILVLIVLVGLGFILTWKPWFFLFLWFIIPCLSWAVKIEAVSSLLTDKGLQVLRYVFIGVVVVISYLFYLSWDDLRDNFGYSCIKGYSVHYADEYDDEGGYYEQVNISANNWFVEKLLTLSLILFLLPLAAANVFFIWKVITKEIKRRDLESSTNETCTIY